MGLGLAGRAEPGGSAVRKAQTVLRTVCVQTHLLGASQAHRGPCRPGFAAPPVPPASGKPTRPPRQAAPGRGDLCGGEERSPGVGARQRASTTDLPQLFERSARQGAQRVLRHDPGASTAAQSAQRADRRSMSPRRVPPAATRRPARRGSCPSRRAAMRRELHLGSMRPAAHPHQCAPPGAPPALRAAGLLNQTSVTSAMNNIDDSQNRSVTAMLKACWLISWSICASACSRL